VRVPEIRLDNNHVETFQRLASKFRKLAEQASDEATADHLRALAAEYEEQAARAAGIDAEVARVSGLACYRYKTPVLTGPWRRRPERARQDAIAARQAHRDPQGDLHWTMSGEIEKSPCRPDAPCGGVVPPPDPD